MSYNNIELGARTGASGLKGGQPSIYNDLKPHRRKRQNGKS